jgi:prepilin-type N-terminal cleavage/methylation domain-containing protein
MKLNKSAAFTLIELLTVIAIIGILAGIIIPAVGAVKTSANKARTKVQFSQWASAISLFKQDYGFYPSFSSSSTPPAGDTAYNLNDQTARQLFVEILAGKLPNGDALASGGDAIRQNKRRASYFSFSGSEIATSGATVTSIQDAFGNTEILVAMDYNYDGLVTVPASSVRGGNADEGFGQSYTPISTAYPTSGIRAGVIFYSAGKGTGPSDIVTSW